MAASAALPNCAHALETLINGTTGTEAELLISNQFGFMQISPFEKPYPVISWPGQAVPGHEPIKIKDNVYLNVPRYGSTLEIIHTTEPKTSHRIGTMDFSLNGHGIPTKDKAGVIVSAQRTADDTEGYLLEYEVETLKLKKAIKTGARSPHDLMVRGDWLYVCNYGHQAAGDTGDYMFDIVEPGISVHDRVTLKQEAFFPYKGNAVVAHLTQGSDGMLYAILLQDKKISVMSNTEREDALANWNLTLEETNKGRAYLPLPIMRIDPATGDIDEVFDSAQTMRRAQSIATHPDTGHVYATHPHSNCLVRLDPETQKIDSREGWPLGLRNMRGVAPIAGTEYIALSDMHYGIAILNAKTLIPKDYLGYSTYGAIHIGSNIAPELG